MPTQSIADFRVRCRHPEDALDWAIGSLATPSIKGIPCGTGGIAGICILVNPFWRPRRVNHCCPVLRAKLLLLLLLLHCVTSGALLLIGSGWSRSAPRRVDGVRSGGLTCC